MPARILLCLLVLSTVWSPAALAAAGNILFARGDVSIVAASGTQRPAEAGDTVNEGDHVLTGDASMTQIRLSDGALVSLRSHSDYQIQIQREEEGLLEQAGTLFRGWMRAVSGRIGAASPQKVSQRTPVATIGIRGTAYQVIHIPDGGLPGYDDTPPGTYIYLEEGGIEARTPAGNRFMSPGDVVWIPAGDMRPRPAPQQRGLFLGELDREQAEDRRALRRLLLEREREDARDRINDALNLLLDSAKTPRAGLGIFGFSGFPDKVRAVGSNVQTGNAGGVPVVTGLRMPSFFDGEVTQPERRLFANQGEAPVPSSVDGVTFNIGGGISWGTWADGTYSFTEDFGSGPSAVTTSGDWHYIYLSDALFDYQDLAALPLNGSFKYGYVGGTLLTNPNQPARDFSITDGEIVLDLGQMEMGVWLGVSDGEVSGRLEGADSVQDFYQSGIGLDDPDNFLFGNIQGVVSGAASGIGAMVSLDEGSTDIWYGTAAFQREGLYRYENVTALGFYYPSAAQQYLQPGVHVQTQGLGPNRRVTGLLIPGIAAQGIPDKVFQADEFAAPRFGTEGFHRITGAGGGTVSEVNWGVYDQADYTLVEGGSTVANPGDWHYMVANNTLSAGDLASIGLSGNATYNYVGGTGLSDGAGGSLAILNSSTIDVDFGTSQMDVALDTNNFNVSGQGNFTDFYSGGISLVDDPLEATVFGNINGRFVGPQAEGIISNIRVTDTNTSTDWNGTAAFQESGFAIGN
jgi:hypothetical protein